MAAALIWRPASYCDAHKDIDLKEPPISFAAIEELLIQLQKSHVGMILICGPQGAIEAVTLLSEAHSWID